MSQREQADEIRRRREADIPSMGREDPAARRMPVRQHAHMEEDLLDDDDTAETVRLDANMRSPLPRRHQDWSDVDEALAWVRRTLAERRAMVSIPRSQTPPASDSSQFSDGPSTSRASGLRHFAVARSIFGDPDFIPSDYSPSGLNPLGDSLSGHRSSPYSSFGHNIPGHRPSGYRPSGYTPPVPRPSVTIPPFYSPHTHPPSALSVSSPSSLSVNTSIQNDITRELSDRNPPRASASLSQALKRRLQATLIAAEIEATLLPDNASRDLEELIFSIRKLLGRPQRDGYHSAIRA